MIEVITEVNRTTKIVKVLTNQQKFYKKKGNLCLDKDIGTEI